MSTVPVWRRRFRWRARLHEVIFESDTPAGRAFDLALLVAILVSMAAVMLESVPRQSRRATRNTDGTVILWSTVGHAESN